MNRDTLSKSPLFFFPGWLCHFKGLFIPVSRKILPVTSWQLTNRTVNDIWGRSCQKHQFCFQQVYPRSVDQTFYQWEKPRRKTAIVFIGDITCVCASIPLFQLVTLYFVLWTVIIIVRSRHSLVKIEHPFFFRESCLCGIMMPIPQIFFPLMTVWRCSR